MLEPLRQDPEYHRFADDRVLLGIANAADVLSSGAFVLAGVLGLLALARRRLVRHSAAEARAYGVFFAAVLAAGIGSAYYHLAPDDFGLMLDRLPIAAAVMALLAALAAPALLVPLVIVGLASVLYWRAFDDLWPYGLVQFGGIAAIVLVTALRGPRYSSGRFIFAAAALYALAKLCELNDRAVYQLTGELASGHTLKHLLAACALYVIIWDACR